MKRDNKISSNWNWWKPCLPLLTLLLALLMLPACYEPEEGCLDVNASNFDPSADRNCADDCCNYPSLNFRINHLMGEQNLDYDSVFYDNGTSDSIRIVKIVYFISEVALLGSQNNLVINDELLASTVAGDALSLIDDFTLVDYLRGQSYDFGDFRTKGTYDSLTFRIGLNNTVNTIDPSSVTDGHPLSIQSDSMWLDTLDIGYALAQVSLVRQSSNSDTLNYFIPTENNSLEVGLGVDLTIDFGETTTISLDVDYLKWLAGIDFVAIGENETEVVTKIVNNLPNSISISE